MLSCCLRCKKETDNNNPQVSETPNVYRVLFVQSFIVKNQDLWKKTRSKETEEEIRNQGFFEECSNTWRYF